VVVSVLFFIVCLPGSGGVYRWMGPMGRKICRPVGRKHSPRPSNFPFWAG